MTSTLISGGAVVTVDNTATVLDPGWVHIVDGKIAAVGAGEPPFATLESVDERVDASGCAVMPGMTNGHTHLFQTFFRGLADDKPLLDWLRSCIWPAAEHLDAETAYHAARIGILENLLGGATCVVDHQYVHPGAEGDIIDDAVCRAADELGVRLLLAHGWADRNYHDPLVEDAQTAIRRTDSTRLRWDGHDNGRIRVELAPLIPWGCSDEAMRATVAAARSWGRGTHIHCAETHTEVDMSLDERSMRHVDWLDSLGALGPDVQLAHSVWLDDDELDLIARRGAVVVHCPVSNMYLASGVARIVEMRQRGITVALASDGAGSNNRQDMFEVLKSTVLLQKVHRLDAMALQPEDALQMACANGSYVFGTPGAFGTITAGAAADLLIVDLMSPFVSPVHRVASALVFNASPANLRDVFVAGEHLVSSGRHRDLDHDEVLESAIRSATALFRRAGIPTRLG